MSSSSRKMELVSVCVPTYNRYEAIERSDQGPAKAKRIKTIHGSAVAADIIKQAVDFAGSYERTLVCLDSNHTHEHALAELKAYPPLTPVGSYCVVFDNGIRDLPADGFPDRYWGPGDNPKLRFAST